ncbi:hypothetical protein P9112_013313 [Eukaryota sp. TZLM1-RC]
MSRNVSSIISVRELKARLVQQEEDHKKSETKMLAAIKRWRDRCRKMEETTSSIKAEKDELLAKLKDLESQPTQPTQAPQPISSEQCNCADGVWVSDVLDQIARTSFELDNLETKVCGFVRMTSDL